MKMHKYTAPDMRTALRKVRAEHGPDALILWTRRTAGVVELTVATDPEAMANAEILTEARRAVGADTVAMPTRSTSRPAVVPPVGVPPVGVPPVGVPPVGVPPAFAGSPTIDSELRSLRHLLETQLAALAWNDLTRRAPVKAALMREFASLGLDRELGAALLEGITSDDELERARQQGLAALCDRLKTIDDRWTTQGGVLSLIGSPGSGKSSAMAGIAARWVLRNGPNGAVLVSAGDPRFGAFEQLARLGRLLGIPTYQVEEIEALPALLARLGEQRLVLVDTGAIGLRSDDRSDDAGLEERNLSILRSAGSIAAILPATLQATAARQLALRYARAGVTACIATRLDEAASLGGLLSAVIMAGLPLAYVTDGTRLPDDLRPARADELIALAVALQERHGNTADEDLLVSRLEGRVHVAS
jgi:flagellar biosynthesis protein FlhF